MVQPFPASVIAGPQSVDIAEATDPDREITPETAARLRDLCAETGEDFDGNLTELQARRRIAALEEVHDLS